MPFPLSQAKLQAADQAMHDYFMTAFKKRYIEVTAGTFNSPKAPGEVSTLEMGTRFERARQAAQTLNRTDWTPSVKVTRILQAKAEEAALWARDHTLGTYQEMAERAERAYYSSVRQEAIAAIDDRPKSKKDSLPKLLEQASPAPAKLFGGAAPAASASAPAADPKDPSLAMQALDDEKLLAYARGKTKVRDSHGREVAPGTLWEGNHTVNPPQFEELNKELQRSLKRVKAYEGEIDGKFGRFTKHGVKQIETTFNFKTDGIAGAQTIAALQVKEAQALFAEYAKDGRLSAAEKKQLGAELSDVATMGAELSKKAKSDAGKLLDQLKKLNIDEGDAILGNTIKNVRKAVGPQK
jgi:hypothetical protein